MGEMKFCPYCASSLKAGQIEGVERFACSSPDCDYVFWDNPTPVVAALVEHEGHVVLVRNRSWPPKWYGLVTGFLERGEEPTDGVLREVREELGQLEGRAYKPVSPDASDATEDRVKVEWVVRAPEGGTVKVVARHERAGKVVAEIAL